MPDAGGYSRRCGREKTRDAMRLRVGNIECIEGGSWIRPTIVRSVRQAGRQAGGCRGGAVGRSCCLRGGEAVSQELVGAGRKDSGAMGFEMVMVMMAMGFLGGVLSRRGRSRCRGGLSGVGCLGASLGLELVGNVVARDPELRSRRRC